MYRKFIDHFDLRLMSAILQILLEHVIKYCRLMIVPRATAECSNKNNNNRKCSVG